MKANLSGSIGSHNFRMGYILPSQNSVDSLDQVLGSDPDPTGKKDICEGQNRLGAGIQMPRRPSNSEGVGMTISCALQ